MEGINIVFKNEEGETKKVFLSKEEIWNKVDCFAYDKLTEPDCVASTCAVNGFCECNQINDGFDYSTIESVK